MRDYYRQVGKATTTGSWLISRHELEVVAPAHARSSAQDVDRALDRPLVMAAARFMLVRMDDPYT
jgi:hypothetical protein